MIDSKLIYNKKNNTDSLKIINIGFLLSLLFISHAIAQDQKPTQHDSLSQPQHSHQRNVDPRYSVFGPPKPALWKFQLSHNNRDNEGASAFTFYKKDQRDKTLLFSIINNGLDNTNQYRVQQISGLIILYPFNDDDRY